MLTAAIVFVVLLILGNIAVAAGAAFALAPCPERLIAGIAGCAGALAGCDLLHGLLSRL